VVYREVYTEGSETAKSGIPITIGRTAYRGQIGRVSKHTFAKLVANNPFLVDVAGIG